MKVVTFGELMLRLAPENYLRFVQSEKYEATFGGAEANVAVSLSNYRGRLQYGFGFRSGSPCKRQRLRQSSKIRLKKLKTNEISPVIKKTR